MSSLAKVFCKAVDLYAQFMETMFNECMPSSVSTVASTEVKSLSEQLASFTFRSESAEAKKAVQFVFTPKVQNVVLSNGLERSEIGMFATGFRLLTCSFYYAMLDVCPSEQY